ncbi:MAG: type II secretion system GspH family protein, partial [Candidatus Omnitrophica bacterium]|nr:type II secretion system GspH family protein [Candidatus Omnitrophota bacterium]MBU1128975.1 type II secretion system GspH family protein [Candidatus Omnitrophota bacterium]MBU1850948.1 type II secretion system GspH family protein [Candidatus Omnitrophota bacterium]
MLFERLKNKRGFTLTEVILVVLITMMVMVAIITAWLFTYKTWTGESEKTHLRVDLMGALETIKADIRLSSLAQGDMVFYPTGEGVYTAMSIPVADVDAGTGLFTVDEDTGIEWARTVIYHIFTEADGSKTLRRTVYDPRDNTMTIEARYTQLADAVTFGAGGGGSTTDDTFLQNLDTFEISPLSSVVDFYNESGDAVQVGKMVFGWAKLDAGDHVIKFEIIDPNPSSSGNDIGLDTIMIEPSGSRREVEFYQDPGNISVSGGSMNYPSDPDFNNKSYAEFAAGGVGSYVEFTDYYDLWRESAFDGASFNNVEIPDAVVRVELKIPEEDEEGVFVWSAGDEVGQQGINGCLMGDAVSGVTPPVAFRTVVTAGNLPWSSNLVRVCLRSSSVGSLQIDRAYITKREEPVLPALPDADGLVNIDPSAISDPAWEDYHKHQQLFFKTGSAINEGVLIAAGSEAWSEW